MRGVALLCRGARGPQHVVHVHCREGGGCARASAIATSAHGRGHVCGLCFVCVCVFVCLYVCVPPSFVTGKLVRAGDVHWSWAVTCVPLWVLFGLGCCVTVLSDSTRWKSLLAGTVCYAVLSRACARARGSHGAPARRHCVRRVQCAAWTGVSCFLLTTAASVVAWADGAPFRLHLALIPLWVIDAAAVGSSVFALLMVVKEQWGDMGRRRCCQFCLRTAAALLAMLFSWSVGALVVLTPVLVVLKVEGVYDIPWVTTCVPALITTAGMALTMCGVGGACARAPVYVYVCVCVFA